LVRPDFPCGFQQQRGEARRIAVEHRQAAGIAALIARTNFR
jgi:hypothetical protein